MASGAALAHLSIDRRRPNRFMIRTGLMGGGRDRNDSARTAVSRRSCRGFVDPRASAVRRAFHKYRISREPAEGFPDRSESAPSGRRESQRRPRPGRSRLPVRLVAWSARLLTHCGWPARSHNRRCMHWRIAPSNPRRPRCCRIRRGSRCFQARAP